MFKFFSTKSKKDAKKIKYSVIKRNSLFDELLHNPHQFSFSKAIDVACVSQNVKLADISKIKALNIEIKSKINFQSKYSDINAVEGLKDGIIELYTNMQGIAGIEGHLPDCYVENFIVHDRESRAAITDFLDIFNSRILSLRYFYLKKNDITCLSAPIEKSLIGNVMLSLSGYEFNKQNSHFEKHLIPEQLKISCQNLFWKSVKSSEGLRCILSSFFEVPIKIEQFSGGFTEPDESLQTSIGCLDNKFNSLGIDSFLGSKTWDSMKGIDIFVGPLSYEKYKYFLPKISKLDQVVSPLQKMKEIIKTYVSNEIDVKLHFYLDKCFVKETFLNGINRLNKDAFLQGIHSSNDTYFMEVV